MEIKQLSIQELDILIKHCKKQFNVYYEIAKDDFDLQVFQQRQDIEEIEREKQSLKRYAYIANLFSDMEDLLNGEMSRRIIELSKIADRGNIYEPYRDDLIEVESKTDA